MKLGLVVFFIFFNSFLFLVQSNNISGNINWWCNQTPYPKACNDFLVFGREERKNSSIQQHEFRNKVIQVASEQALGALKHVKGLGINCRNKRENIAWTDCLKLYESTVVHLNQTLDKNKVHTDFDIQTWLSTSLTNLDTCRTGFLELGETKNLLPALTLALKNVSLLISNCLAINKPMSDASEGYEEGFPSWVPHGDLRILRHKRGQKGIKPDVVVAQDGSGNFHTISAALNESMKRKTSERFVIYVKRGVYDECFEVSYGMNNITLVGDGWDNTIITGNRSNASGVSTFYSATVSIVGNGFIARDITFRNTAGPYGGQAVALLSRSDRSVFYRCSIEGYQDTLCVHSERQFYVQCQIFGTIDIIFGNAAVVFQNCSIYGRKPIELNKVIITAQGRVNPNQTTGISIDRCIIAPDKNHKGAFGPFLTYLGRPWRDYARVVYLKSYLDGFVAREGWSQWENNTGNLDTLYFAEYKNYGAGSRLSGRVDWHGYQVIKNKSDAVTFSVGRLLRGKKWLPWTGVPFRVGI